MRRRAAFLAYLLVFWAAFVLAAAATRLLRLLPLHRLVRALRSSAGPIRILFVDSQPPSQSGHHYRVTLWARALEPDGFRCTIASPLPESDPRFRGGAPDAALAAAYIRSLGRGLLICCRAPAFDVVVVRRELLLFNDNGGAFLDRLLVAANPCTILDFDDNLSMMKNEGRSVSRLGVLFFDQPDKFRKMLATYRYFTPAHASMIRAIEAAQPGIDRSRVLVLPMCVDYPRRAKPAPTVASRTVRFGWVGGAGNLPNLDIVLPALIRLAAEQSLELVVVSGAPYTRDAPFPIVNERWSLGTELDVFSRFDVGLSPLPPDAEQRSIGTFKLVQYMGCGVVAVTSSLSFTRELVEHGANGFLVESAPDWEAVLRHVLERRADWESIGEQARETIRRRHSFAALQAPYGTFLRVVAGEGRS